MDVVYLETDHDSITKQVHAARRKIFVKMGAGNEIPLFGSKATAASFILSCGSSQKWLLFGGMGHGGDDEFEGYAGKNVADVANVSGTMKFFVGKIVHLYSCYTARGLGTELVKRGAKAFIGYNDRVLTAETAAVEELFVSVSAVIDRSILAGDNAATVKQKAENEYQRVNTILTAPGSQATLTDVAAFELNFDALSGPWTGSHYGRF